MIFVHSSFRTSSTYIWSVLRREKKAIAYYEVFHEILSGLQIDSVSSVRHDSWNSKHPASAPYLLEYIPLVDGRGGVKGFDASFSYERFVPDDGPNGHISAPEIEYIHSLINYAEDRGKIPILTATRSLGRMTGLRSAAPGLHVLIYRNLFQQWCSYTEQASLGNNYFIENIYKILQSSQHDAFIAMLLRLFPIHKASCHDENTFYSFIFMHLYLYALGHASADFVLDVNRLANETPYRKEVQDLFGTQGLNTDFSEARNSIGNSLIKFASKSQFSDTIQIIGSTISDNLNSNSQKLFLDKICCDLVEEHERYEFYVAATRSLIVKNNLNYETEIAAQKFGRQQEEELQAQRDTALAELNAARQQREELQAQRDTALAELNAARQQREELQAQRDTALAELNAACQQREELQAQRDTALAEVEIARQASQVDKLRHSAILQ